MHKDYQGLGVANTDPFLEWFEEERGTEILDEYDVFDEVDDGDKPYEE